MKWVFLLLAVAFAIGFLAFGVGSGGTGIGDALQNLIGRGSSDIASVEDAEKKVEESPGDAEALRNLANAYLAEGRNTDAADALERFVKLEPNDEDALRQLVGIYQSEADAARRRAAELSLQSASASSSASFFGLPGSSGFLGAVGTDSIEQALTGDVIGRSVEETRKAAGFYEQAIPVYERLVAIRPDETTLYIQLGVAADSAGDAERAIAAFEKYLELAPDGEFAQLAEEQLKQLGAGAGS